MKDDLSKVSHPGFVEREELIEGSQKAQEWYEQSIWYVARLYVESAQDHPEVREALLKDKGDPQSAVRKHDSEVHDEITDLGLSSYQGLSAEKVAQRHLED